MEKSKFGGEIVKSNENNKENINTDLMERFGNSNPYIVLGVSESSSAKEIASAWKELILQYHPDRNKHPQAKEISQMLNKAIRKLVSKGGALLSYDSNNDFITENEMNQNEYEDIDDEDWYAGDRFWEILAKAEEGRYSDESLLNQKEAREEKEFILDMYADPRNNLDSQELIMTGWDDNGRRIDKDRNVSGFREFTKIGLSIQFMSEQTAIRHKKRIYNSKGEIVFDGSDPSFYRLKKSNEVHYLDQNTKHDGTNLDVRKIEQNNKKISFVFPDLNKEKGEIFRTANHYAPQNNESFARSIFEKAKESKLVDLTDDMWSKLENTDSFSIPKNDFEKVYEFTKYYNKENNANRDAQDLKNKMENGQDLDAPIILKYKNELHLVSGNTRLMLARALSATPKVLLVELENSY